jgi:hypothetical protein
MTENGYQVVWPLGRTVAPEIDVSGGVGSLDDKKVAFVWDYLFRGREMFEIIKRVVSEQFPRAEFVDYEAFGNIHGSDNEEKANLENLPKRMHEHGATCAVVAVGA